MNHISRAIASPLLALAAAPLCAQDPTIRLTFDQSAHSLQVQSSEHGFAFLVLGPRAVPPIQFGSIEIDVVAQFLLPLGELQGGDSMRLLVQRSMRDLSAEAVLVDQELQLHDSNVVSLADAFADLVAATFRAELVSTDTIPPLFTLGASLTAPTSGYDFSVDGFELVETTMNVYLRLVEPGESEIVMPVLTDHQTSAALGTDVGRLVRVYLMRTPRGGTGPEVYRLMAELTPPIQDHGK